MPDFQEFNFESQINYTFIEEIGRGGMGIVYLAERNSGGVKDYVVLKTLKSLSESDERDLKREANLAAQLRHENIVKTYGLETIALSALPPSFLSSLGALSYSQAKEMGEKKLRRLNFRIHVKEQGEQIAQSAGPNQQSLFLMVMDYVDGIGLNSLHYGHIEQGLLIPVLFGAFIISRIARALSYAHNYLVHRDISPENILINTQGTCKLSDFGVAIANHQKPEYWAGKLAYMAPEQLSNQPIDERIDIFSLGSVAYQILTGIPLAEIKSDLPLSAQVEIIQRQYQAGIIPPHKINRDVPEMLSEIVMKMLAIQPAQRYQRANSIANDLEKRFLYAKGYGPTNNSLATYMSIFENRFNMYNEEQLEQLSFLKNEVGEIQIKRFIDPSRFTPEGLALLQARTYDSIYRKMRQLAEPAGTSKEQRLPYLKVKHLDNVLESFSISPKGLVVGSHPACPICVQEESVFPQHFRFSRTQENVVSLHLIDPKTPCPFPDMTVGGKVKTERVLRDGDKIRLGSHDLVFIRQSRWEEIATQNILELNPQTNTNSLLTKRDFALVFEASPATYTQLAKLCEQILNTTNLGEFKIGVIPSALLETLQALAHGTPQTRFTVRILHTPVRLIFICKGFTPEGYSHLLGHFQQHRQRLAQALAERQEIPDTTPDTNLEQSFLESRDSAPKQDKAPAKAKGKPEAKPEPDFMETDFDPEMIAATLIVQSFDRIEFKRDYSEVELAVYL